MPSCSVCRSRFHVDGWLMVDLEGSPTRLVPTPRACEAARSIGRAVGARAAAFFVDWDLAKRYQSGIEHAIEALPKYARDDALRFHEGVTRAFVGGIQGHPRPDGPEPSDLGVGIATAFSAANVPHSELALAAVYRNVDGNDSDPPLDLEAQLAEAAVDAFSSAITGNLVVAAENAVRSAARDSNAVAVCARLLCGPHRLDELCDVLSLPAKVATPLVRRLVEKDLIVVDAATDPARCSIADVQRLRAARLVVMHVYRGRGENSLH